MEHSEIQSLLGAYALDALEADEALIVEQHLEGCPRCRNEVEAHREVAALLGNSGSVAPEGLWEQISARLEQEPPSDQAADLLGQVRSLSGPQRKRRVLAAVGGLVGVAAAVVVAVSALQVSNLNDQVHQDQARSSQTAIAGAAAAALLGPHQTVKLEAAGNTRYAKIAVAPGGQAYWVVSNLEKLASTKTYQLWTVANGRVVSLGLIGSDPRQFSTFRLQPDMTQLMVTTEPEGGASTPTLPVVVQAKVSI